LTATSTLDLLVAAEEGVDSLAVPGIALDFSLRVSDSSGNTATVPLSDYGPIREPLDIRVLRRNLDESRFGETSEMVLQNFSVPLADFTAMTPAVDLSSLREVVLLFDRTPSGSVLVDDIGFASPPPGFLRHRVQPEPPDSD
jgi:hypothetical protein